MESKHRLEWLDSLRGIAAVLVAIMHLWLLLKANFGFNNNLSHQIISFFVTDFFDFGKLGVVMFFMVSGFVIPFSLEGRSVRKFAVGRFFRLYPAYWLSIALFCLIVAVPTTKNLVFNLTMFQKFLGEDDLIGVFWTLQIEIVFYILCAVLHKFNLLKNDKFILKLFYSILVITFFVAFLRFYFDKKLPVALFLGISVMLLGFALRRNAVDKSETFNKGRLMIIFVTFIIILLPICFLAYNKDFGNNETWYKYFVSYLLAIVIFLVFLKYQYINKTFSFLGKISYSLYLLHPVTGMALGVIVVKYLGILNPWSLIGAFWVFSILSATLCFYYVEEPFVKLGKKLSKNIK